jgi:hypothetical protein
MRIFCKAGPNRSIEWGQSIEIIEYMHANPVKRKLVEHAKDWPWSSWSHLCAARDADPVASEVEEKSRTAPFKTEGRGTQNRLVLYVFAPH